MENWAEIDKDKAMEAQLNDSLHEWSALNNSFQNASFFSFDTILVHTGPENSKYLPCWSGIQNNTLTNTAFKRLILECVVPVFPLNHCSRNLSANQTCHLKYPTVTDETNPGLRLHL